MRYALAVLLLLSPIAGAEGFDVSVLAGGTVPLLSDSGGLVGGDPATDPDAETKVTPFVAVDLDAPISSFAQGPALVVGLELGALPGEALQLEQPETYRSLRFLVGLSQPLSDRLNFSLYVECGFATRLAGETTPRDKAPRWCGGGLRFNGDKAELVLTGNADQRLSSTADVQPPGTPPGTLAYQATVGIRGRLALAQAKGGRFKGGKLSLYGSAILGLNLSARYEGLTGGRHDVVTVGVAAGI